jgi:4-amino-4-deoxy-L-arabinose transferase-like glycosyltransferase
MTTTTPSLSLPRSRALAWTRPHAPLAVLLAATAVLSLWGLGRSGTANEFYAAAVKAGTESWKAFLFGSFDSASFITVDKPPAALWAMELSGRLFGFSSWSLLAPQALEGVAAVWLLHATVRRWFGTGAALLSGALLALTPVAVLMFRFDNPDALLVLVLVGAAYATTRALEQASPWWLALAGALVGLGFLTKMLEAFLVVPALGLAYLVAAPTSLPRRVRDLALGIGALVVSGGWWVALVELTPKSDRPFVGGSTNDSVLDLIWGYNGLGRIEGGSGAGPGGGGGANFSGTPGLLRLFNDRMGTEISWLLPAALVVLVAGLAATARRPRTDRTRAALLLWGGWLLVTGLTFSEMSGIVHPYYTNLLAPPIAALVGTGAILLWRARRGVAASLVLAVCLATTGVWSYLLLDRTPAWHPWLRFLVLAGGLVAAVAVVALAEASRRVAAAVATTALIAGAAAPAGYALSTAATPHTGSTPSSGPTSAGGFGRFAGGGPGASTTSSALAALIRSGAKGCTWAAAADSSMTAGPLELATGTAVMSLGGFTGSDDAISLAAFERLVAAGRVHYYVAGGGPGGGGFGGRGGTGRIASWVESHFEPLTVGGTTVYDLTQRTS